MSELKTMAQNYLCFFTALVQFVLSEEGLMIGGSESSQIHFCFGCAVHAHKVDIVPGSGLCLIESEVIGKYNAGDLYFS